MSEGLLSKFRKDIDFFQDNNNKCYAAHENCISRAVQADYETISLTVFWCECAMSTPMPKEHTVKYYKTWQLFGEALRDMLVVLRKLSKLLVAAVNIRRTQNPRKLKTSQTANAKVPNKKRKIYYSWPGSCNSIKVKQIARRWVASLCYTTRYEYPKKGTYQCHENARGRVHTDLVQSRLASQTESCRWKNLNLISCLKPIIITPIKTVLID